MQSEWVAAVINTQLAEGEPAIWACTLYISLQKFIVYFNQQESFQLQRSHELCTVARCIIAVNVLGLLNILVLAQVSTFVLGTDMYCNHTPANSGI